MLDCYLCSDFKESDCFKDKEYKDTLRPYNDTHDSAVRWGGIENGTIISTPCKGHKNDVVKCEIMVCMSCVIMIEHDCNGSVAMLQLRS